MTPISLEINNKKITVERRATLLEAAEASGISIPALCHLSGKEPYTSCMVCLVEDVDSGELLPSCTVTVREGQRILTDSLKVRESRRDALTLLLNEHYGDCFAPCYRGCPAHMDIPRMIRLIGEGKSAEAFLSVMARIPLPATLGRICPAPCEKVCYRGKVDGPLSICQLKRYAGDQGLALGIIPEKAPPSGKRCAVIGAGPAGLSAAYYLAVLGYDCFLFEGEGEVGGALKERARESLEKERALLSTLGIEFLFNRRVGSHITLSELCGEFEAVILAAGSGALEIGRESNIDCGPQGLIVDKETLMTSRQGVFACGGSIRPLKLAVTAVAQGRQAAFSVDAYLQKKEFNYDGHINFSLTGPLSPGELAELMKSSDPAPPVPAGAGYGAEEAERETIRCMECQCRKISSCELRSLGIEYGIKQTRAGFHETKRLLRSVGNPDILFEPGKCIRCGKCVRITEEEAVGIGFINRGYAMDVATPFEEEISRAMGKQAELCVEACPTGALAFLKREE